MQLRYSLLLFAVSVGICLAEDINNRLDCYIENEFSVDEKSCKERNCLWDSTPRPQGVPICYLDPTKVGYKIDGNVRQSPTGFEADLVLKDTAKQTLKGTPQVDKLKLVVSYMTDKIVRFRIVDAVQNRYEVPVQEDFDLLKRKVSEPDENKRKYLVELGTDKSNFEIFITRKETKTKLIDTSIGGLVFADQFLQLATILPTKNIYGFGENTHQSFRHDLNYRTWPMFGRDRPPGDPNLSLYGVQPFYIGLESDGKAHGVLLLNSNAMEYTLLPEPALSLKTMGGVLDFFVFLGSDPEEVTQLYTSLVGRTVMPPFFGLGFQLTRYGFRGTDNVKEVMDRNLKENVPLDVMYLDIDYMNSRRDFTYDEQGAFKGLPKFLSDAKHDHNIRWTLILDPAIEAITTNYQPFIDGYKDDVFVKWSSDIPVKDRQNPPNVPTDKNTIYGKVWPDGPAAFPDFFKNVTKQWWVKCAGDLHNVLPFDAIWIDMNEPSNFVSRCPNNKLESPPIRSKVLSGQPLNQQTLCMSTVQGESNQWRHYDVHSLYALPQSIATQNAVHTATGKRGFVVSRSNYPSGGKYVSHWLGDNTSVWPHLKYSIIGILEYNLFGYHFVGADICGFNGNTNPELCRRWSQLGAFYPFARNHNGIGNIDQDPAVWVSRGNPEVTEAARRSLNLRYQLLHHLYTLFYRAHVFGDTVARPLHHEWTNDSDTYAIDEQFLWGESVLISPFLFENQKEVKAYLPPGELWYEVKPQIKLVNAVGHVTIPDSDPNGPPPVHLRGGSVIPMTSSPNLTTTSSEAFNRLDLVVLPSKAKTASGQLFWDDRESIDTIESGLYNLYMFTLHPNCTLDIEVALDGHSQTPHPLVETVTIGNTREDKELVAQVDGKTVPLHQTNGLTVLEVNLSLDKKKGEKWSVVWKSSKTNECNLV